MNGCVFLRLLLGMVSFGLPITKVRVGSCAEEMSISIESVVNN